MVYKFLIQREWKIIHAALRHYFTTNHRMVDGLQVSEEEIRKKVTISIMTETIEYTEVYYPKDGFSRYASATLFKSACRRYWVTMDYGWQHHWVLDDFGYLVYVGSW